ncbi:MAG TPA: hypothetical protein VGD99_15555 [Anaerolineae bacterium]|jgi:hypothetical protein
MAKYIRPTLHTKFHIDFGWWNKKGQNLKIQLQSQACDEAIRRYEELGEGKTFDWVNPETGEVHQIDILWHLIHTHCSQAPDFLLGPAPLVSAIFRTFLVNNNTPLTPIELSEQIQKKSPELILRTIGRHQVYQGIRPVANPV